MKIKMTRRILLRASFVALLLSATVAASASATPTWRFAGSELTGSETALGGAVSSSMTMSGLTTTCEHLLYNMKISNSGGAGKGEVAELPVYECHTNTLACTVQSVEAKELPWSAHLTEVSSKAYLVIEGIKVDILYGGKDCALDGSLIPMNGTAGGLVENSTETTTFDKASFEATKTKLVVGEQAVEWNGVFPTEAFQSHREQALEVS